MTLDRFVESSGLLSLTETDKVCYLAFYFLKTKNLEQFTALDAAKWLRDDLHLATPNTSRLNANLGTSRNTVKGPKSDSFRLHHTLITELQAKFPQLLETSQDVIDDGTVLPKLRYEDTRGYIESLAKQINASYERNIFDGCAVLMRRLVEILMIHSYEHLNIADEIKDSSGNYQMLEAIIDKARSNNKLALSRNSKGCIEEFRKLGNFSAHKVYYNCTRAEIKPVILDYRALIEELLYKSGIRK